MKFLTLIILLTSMLPAWSLTRSEMEEMLRTKNLSLSSFESRGLQVIMGEVTGHGRQIPMDKLEAIFTDKDVILRREIEATTPAQARSLSGIDTLRARGQYFLKGDVKATIISR